MVWQADKVAAMAMSERFFQNMASKLPAGAGHSSGIPLETEEPAANIRELWENEITPGVKESSQVMRMKKFMNFIGDGVGEKFLHEIHRVTTTADFFRVCENYLAHDQPMTLEPEANACL
jgi:hypothetical protein